MRRTTIYRLSFRLTSKDVDLLWLDADERLPSLSVLVKSVLSGVLKGEQEIIPLPSIPQKRIYPKTIGVRFYSGEDDEIANWIQNIEKGSRGQVVKELLRHAMEIVDFRPYLIGNDSIAIKGQIYKRTERSSALRYVQQSKTPISHLAPESSTIIKETSIQSSVEQQEEEDDDWLSAFEKMSQQ